VLGPEKLPPVVSQVGHWVGRGRGLAWQLREQLEEVQLEQASAEALATSDSGIAHPSAGEQLAAPADSRGAARA